jgi:hypothetical protein
MSEIDRAILPRLDHRHDRRSCQPLAADEAAAVGDGRPSRRCDALPNLLDRKLAAVQNDDDDHAETVDIIRSFVDWIALTPNREGKLDIGPFANPAGIVSRP